MHRSSIRRSPPSPPQQLTGGSFFQGTVDGGYDLGSALGCNMWLFDLSRNQLSGGIPPTLANMQQLRDLNLGENTFTGTIPSQFESMPELKYLRFSRNQLSGKLSMKRVPCTMLVQTLN